jgi:hypothetical protein
MNKASLIRNLGYAVSFLLASQFMASAAFATDSIYKATNKTTGTKIKITGVTSCQSCHSSSAGNESKTNLYPGYRNAWLLDQASYTRLKNAIVGCPAGQFVDPSLPLYLCTPMATQPGALGTALTGAAATDTYTATCPTGTSYLGFAVLDNATPLLPLAKIGIQAIKGTATTALIPDVKDGDGIFSAWTKLTAGAGVYTVKINKSLATTKGIDNYNALISCRTSAGAKLATTLKLTVNQ